MTTSAVMSLSGDAASIRISADQWAAFAGAADTASSQVRQIDSDDFRGDEADLYRETLNKDLPPHLDTTSDAWSAVSSALKTYAATLEELQQQVTALSTRAADQQAQVDSAAGAVADARTADTRHATAIDAQATTLTPGARAPVDTYRSPTAGACSQLAAATAALQSTTDAANQLHAQHDAAVDTCVAAINAAAGSRFQEPPGFWGRLGQAVGGWIRDNADVLKAISAVLKQISSIAGLLAMIPVLAPVMGPLAAAATVGSVMIDSAVKLGTGEGSWTGILMDAAGAVPGGKAAGGVAKGAMAAEEAHAAVGAAKTATALGKDVNGIRSGAADAHGMEGAVGGADTVGGRAVDNADSAVAHDTPVDELPCVGDPIDVVSGQMVLQHTDLELPGVLPLVLTRVYKSGYRWGERFGRSFASTLDQRVEVGANGDVCFVAEDGVVLHYRPAATAAVGVASLPTEGVQRWPLRRTADGGWLVEDSERRVTRRFGAIDAQGCCQLVEIRDVHGNCIDFHYGDRGVVTDIHHSGGYRVRVASADGLVTGLAVVDGSAEVRVASFGYDDDRRMVRVFDADGAPLILDWDAERIVGWHDRNDIWYRYDYDETGRCVRTSGRGRVLSYGFSYLPGRTLVTNSLGEVSTYEYNDAQQVVRTIDPLGNVVASVWDRYDRLLLRTDALGNSTQLSYDQGGRLVEVVHPDGAREVLHRNDVGNITESVDANGGSWRLAYDAAGNLISAADPLHAVTRRTFTSHGAIQTVTDPLGAITTVSSNAAGLPLSVSDSLGATTTFEYDQMGRVVRSVDPIGGVTSFGWTSGGKLSYRVGADLSREQWTWDQEGNLTSYVDQTGATTVIENGIFDLPVSRTEPDGGRLVFGYDTELRLNSVQNPAGLRWRYEYDAAGQLVGETDFNGRTQRYRYDAAGRVVAIVNVLHEETRLTYSAAGHLVERSSADEATELRYDRAGQLLGARSVGAVVELGRDACGRVVTETVNGRTIVNGYDAVGRRVSRLTPSGVLSEWTFDGCGRPQTLTTAGERVDFDFDAAGREVARSFSSGGRLEQRYNESHHLISQVLASAGVPGVVPTISKAFDNRLDGTLTGVVDNLAGTTRRFDLDVAGRVVGVRAAGWTEGYAYDRSGKLTCTTGTATGSGDRSSTNGSPFEVELQEYSGTLVLTAGRVSYRHDRQGRVITRCRKRLSMKPETWHYHYDSQDRMVAATSDGQHWTYTYDAFGRRIAKQRLAADRTVVEQMLFSWDGDRLIEQSQVFGAGAGATEVGTTVTWDYLPGSWRPISQRIGGHEVDAQFYAIVSDLIGTPTELVTPDGGRVAWSNADASVWGAPRQKAANASRRYEPDRVDCPIRFPGHYADNETGLHYNRHRYYDPAAARYTTADPLGLAPAPDPYGYVLNPTGWADPLGLTPCGKPGPRAGSSLARQPLAPRGRIDPKTVRFSQNNIGANFKSGGSVDQLARDLKSGIVDPASIPPIRLVERDGLLHSLDNRRLHAFQTADIDVPYKLATPEEILRDVDKFTTQNGGISIEVRGRK